MQVLCETDAQKSLLRSILCAFKYFFFFKKKRQLFWLGCRWQQKCHSAAPPPAAVRRRMGRKRQKLVGRDKGSLTEQQTKGTGTTTIQIRRKPNTNRTTRRAALHDRHHQLPNHKRVPAAPPAPPTGTQRDVTWSGIPGSVFVVFFSLSVSLLLLFPLFAVLLNCPYPGPTSLCLFSFHSPPHCGGGRGGRVALLLPVAAETKTKIFIIRS